MGGGRGEVSKRVDKEEQPLSRTHLVLEEDVEVGIKVEAGHDAQQQADRSVVADLSSVDIEPVQRNEVENTFAVQIGLDIW